MTGLPPAESLTASASLRVSPSGFGELDELACDRASRGFFLVQAQQSVLDATSRHLERRAREAGRPALLIGGLPTDDAWRELSARLGLVTSVDPLAAAQAIHDKGGSAIVILHEGEPTCWGRALAEELARLCASASERRLLVFACQVPGPSDRRIKGPDAAPRVIEIDPVLSVEEARRWWEAIARDADRQVNAGLDRIDALDTWWSAARATPPSPPRAPISLSAPALRLLARLALSRRSWLVAEAPCLGSAAARDELIASGVLAVDPAGRLIPSVAPPARPDTLGPQPPAPDAEDAVAVADALERLSDPWALMRAAELYAQAGCAERAEAVAMRAFERVTDPAPRADFWRRWEHALALLPVGDAAPRLLRSADLALRVGDVDRALDFARGAVSRSGDTFEALLLLGRVTAARGDLMTAAVQLGKALARAPGAEARARATVELGEVRYLAGDFEEACRLANVAEAGAVDRGTRFSASNLLGKLELARGAYAEAEARFVADACEAQIAGDVMADHRARTNRAVVLLQRGRHREARPMLLAILDEAERQGEVRAVAFALTNLANIASQLREYAEALRLSEQAFELRRRIGDRGYLALIITNLADVRLRIGQIDEAEHALAFGRHTAGPGMPASRVAHFALTAARIHLARGNTAEAWREIRVARQGLDASPDGNKRGECARLTARIAIEEGDVVSAALAIEEASSLPSNPAGRAEQKALVAMLREARGEPFRGAAEQARGLARETEDSERLREAQVILCRAARAEGDLRAARSHLDAAIAERDRFVDRLPEELRASFLARRELVALAELEAPYPPASFPRVRGKGEASREHGAAPPFPPRGHARIIGCDPAIGMLLHAIQKIGPSDATVLIRGESGTGKELVAEAIHEANPRRSGPLVKVNCAALVETLLLSELFGHERGAFTGASCRKRGRFEMAEGGTLFLDEIGDVSPRTQVALLRVLQEKTFERVGGVTSIQADVRILCATHRDLRALVSRGEFREDLYYRLAGMVLDVPALRQRIGDLEAICASILARIAADRGSVPKQLSPDARRALARHAWPGNIRELENALRVASLFAEGNTLMLDDFTSNVDGLRDLAGPGTVDAFASGVTARPSASERLEEASSPIDVAYMHVKAGVSLSDMKRQIERECIERALGESGGNITRAAALLGMKRPRLSQLVKQYGFSVDALGADPEAEEI